MWLLPQVPGGIEPTPTLNLDLFFKPVSSFFQIGARDSNYLNRMWSLPQVPGGIEPTPTQHLILLTVPCVLNVDHFFKPVSSFF